MFVCQVSILITELHESLAECLLYWACHVGLNRVDTLLLIRHLSEVDEVKANGSLADVPLCLTMALLYAIDIRRPKEQEAESMRNALLK